MNVKYLSLLTIVCCLAVAGCGPSGQPGGGAAKTKVLANTASGPSDLLPLSTGNAWTYTVLQTVSDARGRQKSGQSETTLKVDSVKDIPGGKSAEIGVYAKDKRTSSVGFDVTDKGIFQSFLNAKQNVPFKPPMPLMPWPLQPGQELKYSGTGYLPGPGKTGTINVTITYRGDSEVDTFAGRMKALRVDNMQTYTYQGKTFQSSQSIWFVPKVGLVRSFEILQLGAAARQTELKLKGYTVK